MLLLLASCGKKATYLTASSDRIQCGKEGTADTLALQTDGSNLSVASAPEWVEATIDNSVLYYKVIPNEDGTSRTGSIGITCGDQVLAIAVVQNCVATFLSVDQSSLTFGSEGGTQTVNVNTDGGNVQTSSPTGVSADYSKGVLTVTASPNSGRKIRGTIILTCDQQSASINVTVAGETCSRCGGTGKVTCGSCGGDGRNHNMNVEAAVCYKCGGYESGSDGSGPFRYGSGRVTCPVCHGSGS